jgi:phospholipid/cholesterol/gamma-HCH transport system substrate-binding protein
MPRTRSLAWSELRIGVMTIAAIAIAATLIFTLTGTSGFFWQRYSLKTRFPNVAGLAPGSPVRVAGVEVGTVKGVEFAGEQVDVTFEVRKDQRPRITDKSVATLGSVSLLGESAIDISPATQGRTIPDYDYVPAGRAKGSLSDVSEQAATGIEEISKLVHDVRSGRGTVGRLMTDEALYTEMRAFVASANAVTAAITSGRGTIGRLVNDRGTADALEASLKNVEDLTRRINSGEGSLGRLLKDEAFAQSLNGATTNLQDLTARLNRGEGTAGKLITDATLFDRLNSVSNGFDQLVSRLNEGEGTAGQLLKDKQLYENINGAVSDLRAMLTAIQHDPKKYLNVRVSIF